LLSLENAEKSQPHAASLLPHFIVEMWVIERPIGLGERNRNEIPRPEGPRFIYVDDIRNATFQAAGL